MLAIPPRLERKETHESKHPGAGRAQAVGTHTWRPHLTSSFVTFPVPVGSGDNQRGHGRVGAVAVTYMPWPLGLSYIWEEPAGVGGWQKSRVKPRILPP